MHIGDTIEVLSVWLSGRETAEHFRQLDADIATVLASQAGRYNLSPIIWTTKAPGDPRVPPVPLHISGPAVKLLVAEASIISLRVSAKHPVGFTFDLEPKDLALLRRITRRVRKQMFPHEGRLTDRQCDTCINDVGPQAAIETLKNLKRSDLN